MPKTRSLFILLFTLSNLVLAGPAVAAEELLGALGQLDEMGGTGLREEVLDALFARFCIGK